jgi:hypothetical protein
MVNGAHLMHSCPVTPPLLDADSVSGVVESAPALPFRTVTAVYGRLGQLACAVAVAPFAILTVLFVGGEPV